MPLIRRARGAVLRVARRRGLSVVLGLILAVPAAWVEFFGRFDAWWIEGLSLIAGAIGVALVWNGLTGAKPDWIDQ
jgi:hypothetical protein